MHTASYIPSGYVNGTVSGDWVAYNAYADPASISTTGGDADFNLVSGYFTAAWNESLKLDVFGYDDNKLVAQETIELNTIYPTRYYFGSEFTSIDRVLFDSYGGVNAGYGGGGEHFDLDNLILTPESTVRPVALPFPVDGPITQGYGGNKSHNVGSRIQYAVDIAVDEGTEVSSVAGGTVVAVKDGSWNGDKSNGWLGNFVTIRHDGGFYATYAHLSSTSVVEDQHIAAGERLGYSGNTGVSNGAHLHVYFGTETYTDPNSGLLRTDGSLDDVPPAFFAGFFQHANQTGGYIDVSDADQIRPTDIFGTGGDPDPRTDADKLIGGDVNNRIFAGSGDDELQGRGGRDLLVGGSGDDILRGGAGRDMLVGGLGQDTLTGGAYADRFTFNHLNESKVGPTQRDLITDFMQGRDGIYLVGIDAIVGGGDDSFIFIGNAKFSGSAGQLRYHNTAAATIIAGDVDGDGVADFQIELAGLFTLVAGDFVL